MMHLLVMLTEAFCAEWNRYTAEVRKQGQQIYTSCTQQYVSVTRRRRML